MTDGVAPSDDMAEEGSGVAGTVPKAKTKRGKMYCQ